MSITVREVTKHFGGRTVLEDVSITVERSETVVLLGPSGVGKSTLLRIVAGLETPDRGVVYIGGVDAAEVPTHRRGVGYMFQELALFPHLDVARNVAFGLRMQGADRRSRAERVKELLELVGLEGTDRRDTASLSGGERQRVALARALAPRPEALLLDEPFGALDKTLRDRLLGELRRIFSGLDVAVLAVTHDPDEAAALGDRLAVLIDGRIVQVDDAATLFAAPLDQRVASVLGLRNVVAGTHDGSHVITSWGRFDQSRLGCRVEDPMVLIPASAIEVRAPTDPAGVDAEVEALVMRDGQPAVRLRPIGGREVNDADVLEALGSGFGTGDRCRVVIDERPVHVMPRTSSTTHGES